MLERSEKGMRSVEVQDAGIVSRRPRSNINKDKGVGERSGREEIWKRRPNTSKNVSKHSKNWGPAPRYESFMEKNRTER